jgi:16S rRNA (uracil1498-N3)-methyltransferase
MARRRWIADEVTGNRAALVGEHGQHLARVLRARVGQEFDLSADGVVRRARVSAITPDRVEFVLGEEMVASAPLQLALALAIFKFDRMEWAIEKCTELGVSRIVPVIARRTDPHLAQAASKRRERWQRIAREASEQSRRVTPPEVAAVISLKEAVGLPAGMRILLAESEEEKVLTEVLPGLSPQEEILVAVGPEGGWTSEEWELFRQSGWSSVSLGETILRAETAAIAATAIVVSALR